MTIGRIAVSVCVVAAVAPAATASAATVRVARGSVHIEAAAGERNTMALSWSAAGLVVWDRTARLRARGICTKRASHRVHCPGAPLSAQVYLYDRDDRIRMPRVAGSPEVAVTVDGGEGDDLLVTGEGNDSLRGGPGDDVLRSGRGADHLYGGDFTNMDPGSDRLYAGPGNDELRDVDGNGPVGRDTLVGGRGSDFVDSYGGRDQSVYVDLRRRDGQGERGENDRFVGVEGVEGGDGDDHLIGDGGRNRIDGGDGDDIVRGRAGDDRIEVFDFGGGDRATGGMGDDEILMYSFSSPGLSCGQGRDLMTLFLSEYREAPVAGPLAPPSCEWIEGRWDHAALVVSSHPVEVTPPGTLTFALRQFDCCEDELALTEPASPYAVFDTAPIESRRVALDAPADRDTLRVSGPHGGTRQPLSWRFEVPR